MTEMKEIRDIVIAFMIMILGSIFFISLVSLIFMFYGAIFGAIAGGAYLVFKIIVGLFSWIV